MDKCNREKPAGTADNGERVPADKVAPLKLLLWFAAQLPRQDIIFVAGEIATGKSPRVKWAQILEGVHDNALRQGTR